ncbi:MAG: hypothetical protein IIU47_07510, partial [Lachnospiraceae bacterium]|nr:hypothetical protein [Lachnospiraceae bacterium]
MLLIAVMTAAMIPQGAAAAEAGEEETGEAEASSYDVPATGKHGFRTINGKRYYYKKNGKQAFGTYKAKGKHNEIGKRDKWYLNDRTGEVEGVELAVPRIAQTDDESCGST